MLICVSPITCTCGQAHHPGARYYASVRRDDVVIVLAAGPYLSHQEALAVVDDVREIAVECYNPDGRAYWYAYGTVGMPHDYTTPGTLNADLTRRINARAIARIVPLPPTAPEYVKACPAPTRRHESYRPR